MQPEAVVVPIKRFDHAKSRLRHVEGLDAAELARALARGVIESCAPKKVIVLSENDEVTTFAADLGVEVWRSNARGLNEAVTNAYVGLRDEFERLFIIHGDLRHPKGLGSFAPEDGVTLVADHHGQGTNVLVLPTGKDFHFHYGPGSLARHVREAIRLRLAHRVIHDSPWGFDVDEPDDLSRS